MHSHHRCQIGTIRDRNQPYRNACKSKIVRRAACILTFRRQAAIIIRTIRLPGHKRNKDLAATLYKRHLHSPVVQLKKFKCRATWRWDKATLKVRQVIKVRNRLVRAWIQHQITKTNRFYAVLVKAINHLFLRVLWLQQEPKETKTMGRITIILKLSTHLYQSRTEWSKCRKLNSGSKISKLATCPRTSIPWILKSDRVEARTVL